MVYSICNRISMVNVVTAPAGVAKPPGRSLFTPVHFDLLHGLILFTPRAVQVFHVPVS